MQCLSFLFSSFSLSLLSINGNKTTLKLKIGIVYYEQNEISPPVVILFKERERGGCKEIYKNNKQKETNFGFCLDFTN